MSRLSEKQLLILTVGVALLFACGLGFMIWRDLQSIDDEQQAIEDLSTKIASAQKEIDQIPAREYRVIANREISEREVAFLPEETEIETFWEVLERFAEESGVKISKITANQRRAGGGRRKSTTSITSVDQVMKLRGTIDEFLRFINLIENHDRIINVTEYSVSSGGQRGDDGITRHEIKLALRTFTYSRRIANTIVAIPNYEKKKDHVEVKRWLRRIRIEERETYTLRTLMGRRDPFVDVRRYEQASVDGPPDEEQRARQEAQLQHLVDLVRNLEDGLDIEDELFKRKDLHRMAQIQRRNRETYNVLLDQIRRVQREQVFTFRELGDRFVKEVAEPFKQLQDRIGLNDQRRPPLGLEQVRQYHLRVAQAFDEKDWKKLRNEMRAWNEISRKGEHVVENARSLVVEMNRIAHSARVIEQFQTRDIKISAIIFSPNGTSIAVINGKQLIEGDALDPDGRVIVVQIGENYVIFETEGVQIKRVQGHGRQ
ncbi:MAG: type 4a pilus biogenesis protein PilO [Planctomycetota bacterium]